MSVENDYRVQELLADLRQPTVSTESARIAAEYISNLYDVLIDEARCLCCDEVEACDDECTFSDDCPEEAERMAYIRDVLRAPG